MFVTGGSLTRCRVLRPLPRAAALRDAKAGAPPGADRVASGGAPWRGGAAAGGAGGRGGARAQHEHRQELPAAAGLAPRGATRSRDSCACASAPEPLPAHAVPTAALHRWRASGQIRGTGMASWSWSSQCAAWRGASSCATCPTESRRRRSGGRCEPRRRDSQRAPLAVTGHSHCSRCQTNPSIPSPDQPYSHITRCQIVHTHGRCLLCPHCSYAPGMVLSRAHG